jgi:hypothetical protein
MTSSFTDDDDDAGGEDDDVFDSSLSAMCSFGSVGRELKLRMLSVRVVVSFVVSISDGNSVEVDIVVLGNFSFVCCS